jgi:hypothetical protein
MPFDGVWRKRGDKSKGKTCRGMGANRSGCGCLGICPGVKVWIWVCGSMSGCMCLGLGVWICVQVCKSGSGCAGLRPGVCGSGSGRAGLCPVVCVWVCGLLLGVWVWVCGSGSGCVRGWVRVYRCAGVRVCGCVLCDGPIA